jgi:hypothetical protein
MRIAMRIMGLIIFLLGLVFTLTIIGAPLGIPMMIVGPILVGISFFGGSKTTVTNVVHVHSAPSETPQAPSRAQPVNFNEPATQVPQLVSTAKFCSGCGAAVADVGSAFCAECGVKL